MVMPPEPDLTLADAFAPAARRSLRVFGATAELVWLPARKQRPNAPDAGRPSFARDPVPRILANEAQWRGGGAVLTPNRYPFAARQSILWRDEERREHDRELLTTAMAWNDARRGSVLLNTIGAAASIARAHVHCTTETLPFLRELRAEPLAAPWLDESPGLSWLRLDLPLQVVGVRGPAAARASAIAALLAQRLCPAANVVDQDGTAWLWPRRLETPLPHFPAALGAAEFWGRWCYADEAPFAAATVADLERALLAAAVAR